MHEPLDTDRLVALLIIVLAAVAAWVIVGLYGLPGADAMRVLYWLARQPVWKRALLGAGIGAPTMLLITETLRALEGYDSLWDYLR